MTKTIIVINGAPATGKTTMTNYLRSHLDAPVIEKDAIKEFFFDYVGYGDRDMSRVLGKASIDAMFDLARQMLTIKDVLILETAFYAELARADLEALVQGFDVRFIEVYCYVDESVRSERFRRRAMGDRHPGHADLISPDEAKENLERYVPIGVGELLRVDTARFDLASEGPDVVNRLQRFIKEGKLHETN